MQAPTLRFRAILFAIFFLPFFAAYVLLNSFFLTVGDLLGVYRRRALRYIRAHYGWEPSDTSSPVSALWSDYVLKRVGEISRRLSREGWSTDLNAQTVVLTESSFGICIPHTTAHDEHSGRAKRLYYLQGSHFEMGYLLGLMAEKDVARMTVDYVDNVIFDFAGDKGKHPFLGTIIANLIYRLAATARAHLPPELSAELYGIYAGCMTANANTKVLVRDLLVLNYGVDVILSLVYAGAERILRFFGVDVERWKNPAACNGFVITGAAGGGRTFMGRDFMFPTCNVFGDTSAPILYFSDGRLSHEDGPGRALESARAAAPAGSVHPFWEPVADAPLPCLVFTSPGMVGAVAAMNQYGVAMGVDMANGRNCTWRNVGINSLLMVRNTVQWSKSAKDAVAKIRSTRRGVTWLYLVGDGENKTGVVVEAGASGRYRNVVRYVPKELRAKGLVPTQDFVNQNPTDSRFADGMGERWPGWRLTGEWTRSEVSGDTVPWGRFNESLFRYFHFALREREWGPDGQFGADQHDKVVPDAFYFAPQREDREDVLLVTNHFLLPEMRLLAMNEWTAHFASAGGSYYDFQWRYDVLNRRIREEVVAKGRPLTLDSVQDIIDFLRPYSRDDKPAKNHNYYGVYHDRVSRPTEVPIGGAVCAFDLSDRIMRAHYGWYSDEWVEVHFKRFV
ncbi:MAG TPA: hypothetical protein VL354_18005 [Spirochaetia bacterium]|nr:hypothetical protein [Spirochaetia bacterium]